MHFSAYGFNFLRYLICFLIESKINWSNSLESCICIWMDLNSFHNYICLKLERYRLKLNTLDLVSMLSFTDMIQ